MKKLFTLLLFCASLTQGYAMNAASTGSKASKEYTDKLVVTINGESSQTTKITVETPKDGIMNITLPNFCLSAGEDKMYVGTIKVNEIPLTASGLYSTFTTNQTIQIEAGDIPIEGMWLGPMLGDVPLLQSTLKWSCSDKPSTSYSARTILVLPFILPCLKSKCKRQTSTLCKASS